MILNAINYTILFFACFLIGCSRSGGIGPDMAPSQASLQELADLLRSIEGTLGRPPAKVADLSKMEAHFSVAYRAVVDGDIIVLWGTKMKGEGDSGSSEDKLIAYEKATPTDGGFILLNSGVVKKVSANDFGGLPKGK
jgi:hypothetical protein